MRWLFSILFGWLFGHASLRLKKPEQTIVRMRLDATLTVC